MQNRGRIDLERAAKALDDAILGARDALQLADDLLDELGRIVDDAAVSIHRLEGAELALLAERGHAAVVGLLPITRGLAARAVATGETQVARGGDDGLELGLARADAAAVSAPVVAGGDRLVLTLELDEPPTADLVRTVERAAEALGRRYEQLSPRARELDQSRTLARAFSRLSAQRDSSRLLELVARLAGETLGASAAATFVLDDAGRPRERALWRRDLDAPAAVEPPAAAATGMDEPAIGTRRALLPLRAGTELVGMVVAEAPSRAGFAPPAVERAELLALHAATSYAKLREYETVVALAHTDGLTSLANHRRFHEDGDALVEASAADGEPFAVVIADIDDFKDLNDRKGHVAGDDALRLVGRTLSGGVRPADTVYRLGGEEFGVLLPGTTRSNARTVCRRLQRQLANTPMEWRLTVSIGIATYPEDGATLGDIMAAADAALYEAKRLGKDRITLSDERLLARRANLDSMESRGRRSFEQMRSLQALAVALGRARSEAEVGAAAIAKLRDTLNFAVARIYATGADERLVPLAAIGDAVDEPGEQALAGWAERLRVEGRSFLEDDAPENGPAATLGDGRPLRGLLVAPLLAEDLLVGAVLVASPHPSRFDRDDQRLLDVTGTLVGLALENARLLGRQSAAAEIAADLLDAIADLAHAPSRDQAARVALEHARGLVGAEHAWWIGGDGAALAGDAGGARPWPDAPAAPSGLPVRPLAARVADGALIGVPGRVAIAALAGSDGGEGLLAVAVEREPEPETLDALSRLAFHAGVVARVRGADA